MVDYTSSLIWLAAWPLIVFLGYKFAALNIRQTERLEKLEESAKKQKQ
jgi:hypothetical protein